MLALPLLFDRQAQVHRGRHTGSRAIHPQHGHGRLHRGPRRDPHRRAQGRADPDAPPQLLGRVARNPSSRGGSEQKWTWSTIPTPHIRGKSSADYREFARRINVDAITCIPVSAVAGDNIVARSERTPWYRGPSLLEHLETVPLEDESASAGSPTPGSPPAFRMPVQWVNRPSPEFRGFAGMIASGNVRIGDAVRVLPSGRRCTVARILVGGTDVDEAGAAQSVTITLTDEVDVSRGDVLSAADAPPAVANQFEATVVWMHDEPLLQGRAYLLKMGTKTVTATVAPIRVPRPTSTPWSIWRQKNSTLTTSASAGSNSAAPWPSNPTRSAGSWAVFILIDYRIDEQHRRRRITAFLPCAVRRTCIGQALDVNKQARALLSHQKPCILWSLRDCRARASPRSPIWSRSGCMPTDARPICWTATMSATGSTRIWDSRTRTGSRIFAALPRLQKLMVDAGLIVLVSFISPFRSERRMARALVQPGEFFEVHVDTSLAAAAEARDVKGPLQEGSSRRAEELHGHRFTLRTA